MSKIPASKFISSANLFNVNYSDGAPNSTPAKPRLYYLDWLRVVSIGILMLYHAAKIFTGWKYHVQNDTSSETFMLPMQFVNPWRMPLLFFVSGIGIWFALGKRHGRAFLLEKLKRLFIPFVFGVFVLVPPIFYFRKLNRTRLDISYLQFYSDYFALSRLTHWGHVWFLVYLFIFVLIGTPVFLYFRTDKGKRIIQYVAEYFAKNKFNLILLIIPLFVIEWLLSGFWTGSRRLYNDVYHVTFYFVFFLYGYFIAAAGSFWAMFERNRRIFLFTGIICFTVLYAGWQAEGITDQERPHSDLIILDLVWCLNILSWIMCLLGYARRYLNFYNPLLRYSNRATLPCYILHYPLLIAIAYYTVKLNTGIFEKYIIIVIGTFGVTLLLYELIIKRIKSLWVLFGIAENLNKTHKKQSG
jgi:hypothetical protein